MNAPDGDQPIARVSYTAAWYDELGRTTATADYGTADGVPPARPATVPERSDTVLVSETRYNDRGEAYATIDPAGVENRTESDAAGRQIRTIQNYRAESDAEDENVTVEMAYNADGNLRTLTAKNPTTGDQVTRYVYGSHVGVNSPLICRNDLLRTEIYPDSDDTPDLGNGVDGLFDRVEYEYNRQGETIQKKDQNGTVHRYEFDPQGRRVCDRVTELGEGVDGTVRRIERTFDVHGLPETVTSCEDATSEGLLAKWRWSITPLDSLFRTTRSTPPWSAWERRRRWVTAMPTARAKASGLRYVAGRETYGYSWKMPPTNGGKLPGSQDSHSAKRPVFSQMRCLPSRCIQLGDLSPVVSKAPGDVATC